MVRPLFTPGRDDGDDRPPACPFCDGRETEQLSPFGGQLSVAQCWCRRCRTGFDRMKWEKSAAQTALPGDPGPGRGGDP
jgi:hypothetical protein